MPPRYAFWTILIDGKPTAFRARDKEELLPTFQQLRRTNKDIALKWFARGRLWETPEEAQNALRAPRIAGEKRGGAWRPGGAHADPRARFKKGSQPRQGDRDGGSDLKPSRPRESKHSARPAAGAPRGDRPWTNRPPSGGAPPRGDRPWTNKPPSGGAPPRSDRPWTNKPPSGGAPPRGDRPWTNKPPSGGAPPRSDRPWTNKPPSGGAPPRSDRPWTNKHPSGDRSRSNRPPDGAPRGDRKPAVARPDKQRSRLQAPRDRPWSHKPPVASPPVAPRPPSGRPHDDRPSAPDGPPDRREHESPPMPKPEPRPEPPVTEQIVIKPDPPERG